VCGLPSISVDTVELRAGHRRSEGEVKDLGKVHFLGWKLTLIKLLLYV
jgi:hypothetical protein